MYDLILQLSLVVSLSAMIYLLARAIPKVRDEDGLIINNPSHFERWMAKIPVSRIDAWATMFTAKFLRRLRVIVLKIDNLLHRHITAANSKKLPNGNGNLIEDLNKKETDI